jgi:hypothetical protein
MTLLGLLAFSERIASRSGRKLTESTHDLLRCARLNLAEHFQSPMSPLGNKVLLGNSEAQFYPRAALLTVPLGSLCEAGKTVCARNESEKGRACLDR